MSVEGGARPMAELAITPEPALEINCMFVRKEKNSDTSLGMWVSNVRER